jgi:hypothetical protein
MAEDSQANHISNDKALPPSVPLFQVFSCEVKHYFRAPRYEVFRFFHFLKNWKTPPVTMDMPSSRMISNLLTRTGLLKKIVK